MSFELKLASKYFRARRRSLARFTAAAAIIGIAAGVASLIVAQALAKGFADEMRDKILANTAHIAVFLQDGGEISGQERISEDLRTIENVREIAPTADENAFLIGENAVNYANLRVISNFKFQFSNPNEIEIAVGARLAEKCSLQSGAQAEIIMLENGIEPVRVPVRVGEIFQTGLYDYDAAWIYVSPANHARIRGQRDFAPTILNVSVRDIYKADETARAIRARLGDGFKVVDWQEANRPLFAALSLERKVAFAVIALIIFIAALNITTTLALLVNERRLDIAILRTCGASSRSLVKIFLIEGLMIGLTGILAGVGLGLAACLAGNYWKIVSIPAEVYSLNYIPLKVEVSSILPVAAAAFALSLAACAYPSLKASRIKPLENLRMR